MDDEVSMKAEAHQASLVPLVPDVMRSRVGIDNQSIEWQASLTR
jgi:hypothetical protein